MLLYQSLPVKDTINIGLARFSTVDTSQTTTVSICCMIMYGISSYKPPSCQLRPLTNCFAARRSVHAERWNSIWTAIGAISLQTGVLSCYTLCLSNLIFILYRQIAKQIQHNQLGNVTKNRRVSFVVLSDTQISFDVVHAVRQSLFVPMFCGVIRHVLYKRLRINGYLSFVVSPDTQLFICTVR